MVAFPNSVTIANYCMIVFVVDADHRFHKTREALFVNFAFAGSKKIVFYCNVFTT